MMHRSFDFGDNPMKEKKYTMCVRCLEKAKIAFWGKEIKRIGDIDFTAKCRCGGKGTAEYVVKEKTCLQ